MKEYKYETDELGRVSKASGELSLEKGERSPSAQLEAGGDDRLDTDDGGHLIGTRFAGSGEAENLVPMDRRVNRKVYKSFENAWADALEDEKTVDVAVEAYYSDEGLRPSAIMGRYSIDGKTPDYFSITNWDLSSDEYDIDSYDFPDGWDGMDHSPESELLPEDELEE